MWSSSQRSERIRGDSFLSDGVFGDKIFFLIISVAGMRRLHLMLKFFGFKLFKFSLNKSTKKLSLIFDAICLPAAVI